MDRRVALAFQRFDAVELRFCRLLNRSSRASGVRQSFQIVSRLGDGWIWYAILLTLPVLYGTAGLEAMLHAALTGAVGLALYKLIKKHAVRERPYITHPGIDCATAPLDRYSFPSGHTLHAVCFTVMVSSYFPEWTSALATLALLIALSRVILGLHYPTDVAAGAALGGSLAAGSLLVAQPLFA
jgi:undecaprenyl-diphosphatase